MVAAVGVLSAATVFGQSTSTLTFTAACDGSGTSDDGLAWTVTSDANESTYDSTSGIHYGTSKAAVSYLQLTTTNLYAKLGGKTITNITVNARDKNAATLAVSVGSSTLTAASNNPTMENTSHDFSFNGSVVVESNDEITIRMSRSSAKQAMYIKSVVVTYTNGGGSSLADSDLAITSAPVSLSFDLYNNASAQTVNYTTSSTGTINIANSAYATFSINTSAKTITVTPSAVTPSAQTITVNQVADASYKAGSATFTITVSDSTPYEQPTEIEITPNYTFWGQTAQFSGSTYSSLSGSKDNVTLEWSRGNGSTYANQSAMRFYKENELTFTAPNEYEIKSIELAVTGTFDDLEFSPDGWDGTNTIWSGSSETVTMSRPSNASSYATITKFTITIGAPSTDPVISANNVNIAYDATGGSIAFTVDNPVDGGVVSASTEADWITPGSAVSASPIAFTCTANNETTPRSATVTLTYTYNTNKTVTKNVTVTQAASPVIYSTIPALFAAATSTETEVHVTFNNWVVSGVSTNGKNVFVTDNSGNGFVIFDNNGGLGNTYSVGAILSGSNVTCNLVLYNGFAEIKSLDSSDLTITSGGTVSAANIAMASLAGVNTGSLVSYDGLECSVDNSGNTPKYYLSDGTTTLQVFNSLYAFNALEAGKTYNISGIYQQYNNTKEILPRSAADIEEVVITTPSITVASATVDALAAETYGTLDITYGNLPITQMSDFAVQYYDDGDNEINEPAWIEVLVAEQDPQIGEGYVVSYYMLDNDGAARSAYFKVWALDANDNAVYSNLVTINQAAYVADYANLPFDEYDGNGTGTLPAGLTVSGTGTYANSPKIKFDGAGDYMILKINEDIPSTFTLAYTIKGNPSNNEWAGSFKVQTSTDGSTYTDFKEYTSFGTSGSDTYEEAFDNLDPSIRYIKWLFETKSKGNVGVGNISLTRPDQPASMVVSAGFNDGKYWATFFNSAAAYTLTAGAKAYTLNSSKQLYLLGDGSTIPANTAVIIIADSASITLNKTADTAVAISGGSNILKGSNYGVVVGDIPSGVPYVLGIKSGVLNFYKFAGEAVPANRAYYIVKE